MRSVLSWTYPLKLSTGEIIRLIGRTIIRNFRALSFPFIINSIVKNKNKSIIKLEILNIPFMFALIKEMG